MEAVLELEPKYFDQIQGIQSSVLTMSQILVLKSTFLTSFLSEVLFVVVVMLEAMNYS